MSETTLQQPPTQVSGIAVSDVAPPVPGRLQSLDVFRGITIAAMLLVNDPGSWSSVYPPLEHAEWHGWTPTDLIFPFFLFIVGVAMVFSFAKAREKGEGKGRLLAKSAKRAVILFVLGLAIYSYPWIGYDFSQQRIPGVLQRIALAFLAASAALLWLGPRARLALTGALLFGYWAVMSWVPVPGIGAGVLEPGQDLGSYIDRAVFGTNHLWASSRTWDPEGLLSTLPAVATVLLGIFAGEWLRSQRMPARKVLGLAVAGVVGVVLGLLWNEVFPINKKLWTSSFVVFTAGMGAVGLALCYWVVDVKGYRRWTLPFLVLGMNAITAYFLAELMAIQLEITPVGGISLKEWIYQNAFATWLSPVNASLAYAIAFVLFWMVVMWGFYRKRIFIKV